MPWKASSVVEERTRFVLEYERGLCGMAELCRRYAISRETGYVWWRRYGRDGLEGLRDRSRAPHEPGNRTPEQIEAMVLELRREHMRWGPRKLKWLLEQAEPGIQWPAASTIGALLAREGLAMARKKAPSRAALHAAVCCGQPIEPGMVRRFQGLVPDAGWSSDRPSDHHRRPQPLFVALPGSGED